MSADLRDWNRGDVLEATHLQEGVSAIRKMLAVPGAGVGGTANVQIGGRTFRAILGKIVAAGPKGESDLTGERYWVQEEFISSGNTEPLTLANKPPIFDLTFDVDGHVTSPYPIYPVTNLPELKDHTHALTTGTYVWFFAMADDAGNPTPHFLMSEGGAGLPAGQYDGQIPQTTSQLTLGMNFLRLVNVPPV